MVKSNFRCQMRKYFMLFSFIFWSSCTHFCGAEDCREVINDGFYVSLSGGALFDNTTINGIKATNPGFYIGSSVGYKFCNSISLEGEFSYQSYNINRTIIRTTPFLFNTFTFPSKRKETMKIFAYMGNVFYDFDFITFPFKPYFGMGMGYADASSIRNRTGMTSNGIAWQAIAGISYPICQKTALSLEYRYFDMGGLTNNKVGLSLSRYF